MTPHLAQRREEILEQYFETSAGVCGAAAGSAAGLRRVRVQPSPEMSAGPVGARKKNKRFRQAWPSGVISCGGVVHAEVVLVSADRQSDLRQLRDLTPSLVASLRSGDTQAGVLLNRLYREPIVRFCWGYLGSREEAEDAAQEVFCKLLAAPRVPEVFRPWLYKVARNHCLNLLRGNARRKDNHVLPSDSRLDLTATGNLTKLVRRELRSRLSHLVGALPTMYREVLQLRYAEGLSRAEIAEVLELPESVVKSRLFEGLKKLRQHSSLLTDL